MRIVASNVTLILAATAHPMFTPTSTCHFTIIYFQSCTAACSKPGLRRFTAAHSAQRCCIRLRRRSDLRRARRRAGAAQAGDPGKAGVVQVPASAGRLDQHTAHSSKLDQA